MSGRLRHCYFDKVLDKKVYRYPDDLICRLCRSDNTIHTWKWCLATFLFFDIRWGKHPEQWEHSSLCHLCLINRYLRNVPHKFPIGNMSYLVYIIFLEWRVLLMHSLTQRLWRDLVHNARWHWHWRCGRQGKNDENICWNWYRRSEWYWELLASRSFRSKERVRRN